MITISQYEFYIYSQGEQNLPALLFLHGFMGDHRDFEDIISSLCGHFYCLAIDLPGHGNTQIKGGDQYYAMENIAEAVIELLNQLNIQKCFLVGYSMGGRLGLYLTLKFPERFYKVILESASPGLKTEDERLKRIKADEDLAQQLETMDFYDFLIKWYQNPLFISLKKSPHFEKILQYRLKNNPFQLAKSLRNMSTGKQPCLWKELHYNKIPLLLVVGENDDKFKKINHEMASYSPLNTLKILKQSGHNIHWENMRDFLEEIRSFFGD